MSFWLNRGQGDLTDEIEVEGGRLGCKEHLPTCREWLQVS